MRLREGSRNELGEGEEGGCFRAHTVNLGSSHASWATYRIYKSAQRRIESPLNRVAETPSRTDEAQCPPHTARGCRWLSTREMVRRHIPTNHRRREPTGCGSDKILWHQTSGRAGEGRPGAQGGAAFRSRRLSANATESFREQETEENVGARRFRHGDTEPVVPYWTGLSRLIYCQAEAL